MLMAVSPYHLTSRELPVMAGALLAERVVTMLPVPGWIGARTPPRPGGRPAPVVPGREDVRAAMIGSPSYLRLLESWRWLAAMFEEGVVCSLHDDEDVADELPATLEALEHDPRWSGLKRFAHDDLLSSDRAYLETISRDVLKGGPDPGVSLAVHAGIDRFAVRHGLAVLRLGLPASGRTPGARGGGSISAAPGATGSVARRAEELLGRTVFSMAVPLFGAAGGEVLMVARESLAGELRDLRAAMGSALEGDGGARAVEGVRRAAARFAGAFERFAGAFVGRDDAQSRRISVTTAKIVCRRLPVEAVLASSAAALRQVESGWARRGPAREPAREPVHGSLAEAAVPGGTCAGGEVVSLVVSELGVAGVV